MKRVAVVGSGISGLAAAYLISRRHRVTLFERDARLGGHTHTVRVPGPGGEVALDTGFLVHNHQTYPNLVRLFREIGVATEPSDMSFSVSCPTTGFEYSSRGVAGFFAQPRNLVRPAHHRLLRDILRFNREAPAVLTAPGAEEWTVDGFLRGQRYGADFVTRYLAPMTSAIWSCPVESIAAFPVQTLVRFMHNHGMLAVGAHPTWYVVTGGSDSYIPKLTLPLHDQVRLDARIRVIRRGEGGVALAFDDGHAEQFDDVVLACHGDQVLPLLADATAAEREVFGAFTTTANEAVLHTDTTALPAVARAWASWNYRLGTDPASPPTVTYHLNRLQNLSGPVHYCVTLNPQKALAAHSVIGRYRYRHPRVTVAAIKAQARWREVSGVGRTHYCGAYWRYGFHEDGLMSAQRVAADFGVRW